MYDGGTEGKADLDGDFYQEARLGVTQTTPLSCIHPTSIIQGGRNPWSFSLGFECIPRTNHPLVKAPWRLPRTCRLLLDPNLDQPLQLSSTTLQEDLTDDQRRCMVPLRLHLCTISPAWILLERLLNVVSAAVSAFSKQHSSSFYLYKIV